MFGGETVSVYLSFLFCFDNYIFKIYNLEQTTQSTHSPCSIHKLGLITFSLVATNSKGLNPFYKHQSSIRLFAARRRQVLIFIRLPEKTMMHEFLLK